MSLWDPRIARAVLFAEQHLASPDVDLSLSVLARVAAMSPFHFHRAFREEVGEPVSAWVRRLRLERAASLLRHGDLELDRVARLAGYRTQAAFTRAFSRRHGAPPGRWRAQQGTRRLPAPASTAALRVVSLPAMRLAWVRHTGDWEGLAERLAALCGRFDAAGWFRPSCSLVLVLGDEPDIPDPSRLRVDLGLTLPDDVDAAEVPTRTLPACKAAVFDVVGDYETLEAASMELAYRAFPASGLATTADHQLVVLPGRVAWAAVDDLGAALVTPVPMQVAQPLLDHA